MYLASKPVKLVGILFVCLLLYCLLCTSSALTCAALGVPLSEQQMLSGQFVAFPLVLVGASTWYLLAVDKSLGSHLWTQVSTGRFAHCGLVFFVIISSTVLQSLIMEGGVVFWPSALDCVKAWALHPETWMLSELKDLLLCASMGTFLSKGIVCFALLPAVAEELLFRGVVQNMLLRNTRKPFWAIAAAALLFAIMHFRPYSSAILFGMGVLFGYVYRISKNILLAVFAHFLNNSLALADVYFAKDPMDASSGYLGGLVQALTLEQQACCGIVAALVISVCLRKLRTLRPACPRC